MMTIPFRKTIYFAFAALCVSSVSAQNDCPAIIQNAFDATDAVCTTTSRNQACYGNIMVQAEPQENVSDFNFETPGDMVDLAGVDTLTLLYSSESAEESWGVVFMQIQANLPESPTEQNVTLLAFGDVEIRNAIVTNPEPVTLEVVSTGNINVRSGPSTAAPPIGQLANGETALADGRNPETSWLRIQLADGTPGWVFAELVTLNGDPSLLELVDPLALPLPPLTPMQAFYFRSGIDDSPCDNAPDSGILIQAPAGVGQITLTVNDVSLQFSSTVYLQAQPDGDMTVSAVDDDAVVSAGGITRFVPAGTRVRIPLDANLVAAGIPGEPEPYDDAALAALPVDHMLRPVVVAPALTQAQIDEMIPSALPVSGTWLYIASDEVTTEGEQDCLLFSPRGFSREVTLAGDFSLYIDMELEYSNPEPGLFVADFDVGDGVRREEIRVISPTLLEGVVTLEAGTCLWTQPFRLERLDES
jgi:hypothetical protein